MISSDEALLARSLVKRQVHIHRYFIPIASVSIALVVNLIGSRIGGMTGAFSPYVMFSVAVVVSAVWSGFWSGLIATLLAFLATGFFHLDPIYSLRVVNHDEAVLLAQFLVEGILLSTASTALGRGHLARERKAVIRYGSAIGIVMCAVLLKALLSTSLAQETVPFMLFYAAVMLSAWIGGPSAGVTASACSAAAAAFLFFEPRFDFRVTDSEQAGQLILFLFEGGIISIFSGSLSVIRKRAMESERLAIQYWEDLKESERRLRRHNLVLAELARKPVLGATDTELTEVLRNLTEAATKTADVTRASVWMFPPSRQQLQCFDLYDRDRAQHTAGMELRAEDYSRYFLAIEENRPIIVQDARADDRTREIAKSYSSQFGTLSKLDTPIRMGGLVAGVVCLEHSTPARKWTIEDEQFASSIADFVALAFRQHELRVADERLRSQASILDQAQDAILTLDPEGCVLYWNCGAERLYGWSSKDVLGQQSGPYLDSIDGLEPSVEKSIRETGVWVGELRQRTREGREVIVAARWTRIYSPSSRADRLMIATDVTERKTMEQKLLRAQRMESIGALASGIAHDLNNLLTPVLMGADLLQGDQSPEIQTSLLTIMRTSAERAASLLLQILSFAKGSEKNTDTIKLRMKVREIADFLAHTLPKHIEVKVDVPVDTWEVNGPSSKIDQILMNLCVNARDAMPKGGKLVVSATNRELLPGAGELIPSAQPGRYVLVTVSDTGTGIPPEILDRIFDPFFTTKEPGKGTGLGLSTTKDIVLALGGFLRVDSQVGKGTRFDVYLPAAKIEGIVEKPDSKEMPIGWGELILVVDDETSVRELARRVLESYGYRVIVANDGAEALEQCAKSGSQLRAILLDMMMPGQDLAETLRQLQSFSPGIPLILTTGASGETVEKGPELGEKAFLAKPYSVSQLLRTVRQTIGPPDTSSTHPMSQR